MRLVDELKKYCDDCLSDRIPACKKHKWACMRYLDDISNAEKSYFPFKFSENLASRFVVDWMGLFRHTKGPLAGEKKIAHIYEKFFYGQLYGWIYEEDDTRRFRQAYLQVARKNAKSQDLAIVGTYEMSAMNESCAEIYIAATKKEQTMWVWGEADLILRRSPILRNRFKTTYGVIRHLKSNSIFVRMTEEDKKKGDGGSPQCGIIDEYHAHDSDEYYNILSSGMKIRKQPLLIIISTAGFDLSHPCYKDEYQYVSNILNPNSSIENDRYLADIFELDKDDEGNLIDDIKDEKTWAKSNPILIETKEGLSSIRAELKVALDKPEKMRDFLTKTMNVWVSMREAGYMDIAKWKLCAGIMPDFKGKTCYIGIDLSSKLDLTSVTFEIPIEEKYYILSHSFMPQDTLNQKNITDKVPYMRWVIEKWITATPGPVVNFRHILEYIYEQEKLLGFYTAEICIDPWSATQISNELIEKGYTVVDIIQGIKTLSEPTKDFREMVYDKRIVHNDNPVLSWAMGNAIVDEVDRNKNIILSKKKSKEKIDPVCATINAHVRAMIAEPEGTGRVIFI